MEGVSPAHTIDFKDQVLFAELSPYEWSQNLICIAFSNTITVGKLKFQEDDDDMEDDLEFTLLHKFHHEVRPDCLAWYPDSSISSLPKRVIFATGGADYQLRLFKSDLKSNNTVQILEGHTGYINSVTYDLDGDYLASGSDDFTCKVWAVKDNYKCTASLNFANAVVSVSFHREEPGKLMVALKKGRIIFVNVTTQQRIMSFDSGCEPLLCADWSQLNSLRVVAVAEQELTWWDTSKSRIPAHSVILYGNYGNVVRCSPKDENFVATFGEPDHQLKVVHSSQTAPRLTANLQLLTTNLSWHHHLPYICAGNDQKVCFWKVMLK